MGNVVVLVVGYCNPDDIVDCLRALAAANAEPSFDVYIAENGGAAGMDMLLARLDAGDAAWRKAGATEAPTKPPNARRLNNYRLVRPNGHPGASVHVAEMDENLGYAGGVNAWLRPLLTVPEWDAAWVLNPDTKPDPDALAELAAYSTSRGKAMVGSCIIHTDHMDKVFTRGLEWNKFRSRVQAIDRGAKLSIEPDPEAIEARLSAPSGASIYITRPLIDAIGLMDERYFLYCEELEWGERAQRLGMLGYAHRSRVPHKCGTTLGGTGGRLARSKLSVYLSARNTILFVKKRHPFWLPWAIVMQTVHLATY